MFTIDNQVVHISPVTSWTSPQFLLQRMKKLAPSISKTLTEEHGTSEFLKRIAHPLWFQSFGCVLGFDWHSSGLTTVVIGVLKHSIDPQNHRRMIARGKGKKIFVSKERNSKISPVLKYIT